MKKLLVFWLLLVCPSLGTFARAADEEPHALFSRAYALFSQGNSAEAEPLFAQTLNRDFPLEDYSLHFLGQIRTARSDWEGARGYFSQLKQRFPQSLWAAQADLQLAQTSLAEKDYGRAVAELERVQGPNMKKELAEQARYLLGQAFELQGDFKKAYAAYSELRKSAPQSRWDASARRAVKKLRDQEPDAFALRTTDLLAAEAELLIRERAYDEAGSIYRRLLETNPESKQRAQFLMGLANVYRAQRKRDEAISILTEVVTRYPDAPDAANALYRLAVAFWNRDENSRALEYFDRFQRRYPKNALIDFSYFAAARIYESLGRTDDALRAYQEFGKKFPGSKWLNEALWREAWIYYLRGDYAAAYSSLKRLAALPNVDNYKNAALYWQGRTAEKLERADEAGQLFLQILRGQDDTYYKGPAAKRLAGLGATTDLPKPEPGAPVPEPVLIRDDVAFHLQRARALAEIALKQLAVNELDEIQGRAGADLPLSLLLIREYTRNDAYWRSAQSASQIDSASDEIDRYRYPLAYWSMVQKAAADNGLDPYLVLALMRQESFFDPTVLSPAAAHGLMQLLPSTAARTAAQAGLPAPSPEKLFDPDLNLLLGARHLKELLDLNSNDAVKAIAAYNAGQSAVARWEKQIVTSDPEEFIERIPFSETRLYVKLVLRNHLRYRRIYGASP